LNPYDIEENKAFHYILKTEQQVENKSNDSDIIKGDEEHGNAMEEVDQQDNQSEISTLSISYKEAKVVQLLKNNVLNLTKDLVNLNGLSFHRVWEGVQKSLSEEVAVKKSPSAIYMIQTPITKQKPANNKIANTHHHQHQQQQKEHQQPHQHQTIPLSSMTTVFDSGNDSVQSTLPISASNNSITGKRAVQNIAIRLKEEYSNIYKGHLSDHTVDEVNVSHILKKSRQDC
jgi:hypothetical protein